MRTPSQVTKGYLAILDGDYLDYVFTFPINPAEIKDSHDPKYADHAIIGRGHPLSHYTSGGPRVISFTLEFDAKNEMFCMQRAGIVRTGQADKESQRSGRIPITVLNKNYKDVKTPITVLSNTMKMGSPIDRLEQSVRFLQSLTYPREFQRQRGNTGELLTGPPPLLFVFGKKRLRCILRGALVTEKEWNADLRLLRASVDIELHEQPLKPVTFQSYLSGYDGFSNDDVRSV